jgi:4-carboxymuconolactone decarboxylase
MNGHPVMREGAERRAPLDYMERLRRLTINATSGAGVTFCADDVDALDPRSAALVRLAALVAVGGADPSYGELVDGAVSAGASAAEVVGVLVDVASVVGLPAVVAAAPKVARALGYDSEDLFDESFEE